ncbi:MAG TPA: oligopeptide/dipeptide ABC transporter ATP-binding protein [Acidimicrobiia bacterium]
MSTLLEVKDLKVHFPASSEFVVRRRETVRAVDGISFSVPAGKTLGLVGETGCGKSTTARAILQLIRPTDGKVWLDGIDLTSLDGEELRRMRRRMQMIFQDPYASLNPRMTVAEIVAEPLEIHGLVSGKALKETVNDLLAKVGLSPKFATRYPHQFSGGQRQRIGIARALALRPDLIVADEPISALDVSVQAQIINLLESLQDSFKLTYLVIAHDLAVVRHMSDQVAVMYLGKIVELADRVSLYKQPRHPYTQALLSAVPIPDPAVEAKRRRILLSGDVPSPIDPPSGCRFRTRCWKAQEICAEVEPPLDEKAPGHLAACHFPGP